MKIDCHCGAVIVDQTDYLPHKGHLIPDQEWFATHEAIDNELIDPLAAGRLGKEAAYYLAREIIMRATRFMWQCRACGRLYVDGSDGQLRCFVPEGEPTDHEVLRSRPGQDELDAAADAREPGHDGAGSLWPNDKNEPPLPARDEAPS